MKKEETPITLANGGMHSQVNYRKAKEMLLRHNYSMPRLYHLVFTGSTNKDDYLYAINALCEEMRNNNIPCKWKGCVEVDENKGLHMHFFILLDAKHGKPDYYIRYAEDGFLVLLLKERGLGFNISQPRNKIHRTKMGKLQNHAYLAKGEKLADCLIWISYLYKARSKDDSMKTIYHSSRERVRKETSSLSAAPTAAEEVAIQETRQSKESENERISEAQTSASQQTADKARAKASRYSTSQSPANTAEPFGLLVNAKAEQQGRSGPTSPNDSRIGAPPLRMRFRRALRPLGGEFEKSGWRTVQSVAEAPKTRLNQSGFKRANFRSSFLRFPDIR